MVFTIEDLIRISDVIKIKKICEITGIKYPTIMAKINRKTELTIKESDMIVAVLRGYGLYHENPGATVARESAQKQRYDSI